jgi:Transglycosylase SLT domain
MGQGALRTTPRPRRVGARAAGVCGLALLALLAGVPRTAGAEIIRLSTGRVVQVASCRFEDDMVVMSLKDGGEVRAARSLVLEVLPDEVPTPEPEEVALAVPEAPGVASLDAIYEMIDRLATNAGVDPRLAHAVVRVESNYQVQAVSPKGAVGLMQLMPVVIRQYELDDPFDPEQNLDAGLRYLRTLLDRFSTSNALAAYNAGEGAVARYGGVPPFPETQEYVRRVMALAGVAARRR